MRSTCEAFCAELDPLHYRPHGLHAGDRDWPQTNCYADLWIEVAAACGYAPEAMFGFTTALDFEGDQFTFYKPPLKEIEQLYGLNALELSIYDSLPGHIEDQCARARLVLLEMDAYYLPDTRGVSYKTERSKTTIGVNVFNREKQYADYFHNEGYFRLEGEDFRTLFRVGVSDPSQLPPYAEFVKRPSPKPAPEQTREKAEQFLAENILRRPSKNPIAVFAKTIPDLIAHARAKNPDFFHKLAFNTWRMAGSNFELLASHLNWLDGARFSEAALAAKTLSEQAKIGQFLSARALLRNKPLEANETLEAMMKCYDRLFVALDGRSGAMKHAS